MEGFRCTQKKTMKYAPWRVISKPHSHEQILGNIYAQEFHSPTTTIFHNPVARNIQFHPLPNKPQPFSASPTSMPRLHVHGAKPMPRVSNHARPTGSHHPNPPPDRQAKMEIQHQGAFLLFFVWENNDMENKQTINVSIFKGLKNQLVFMYIYINNIIQIG